MVADAPRIIDKIGEMAALLQNTETIIGYNGKHFDIPFLERYGIRFRKQQKGLLPVHTGSKPFFIQFFMKGMIYL